MGASEVIHLGDHAREIRNKEYQAQYREKNKEKAKEYSKQWRAKNADATKKYRSDNSEKITAYKKMYNSLNAEKQREVYATYCANNKDKVIAATAKWREKNKEYSRAQSAQWRMNNPDAVRVGAHNRRARKRLNGGNLSIGISIKLLRLQKYKCACCNKDISAKHHMDHVVPLALGGCNSDENIQMLCPLCNLKKGSKSPVEFMQSRGFLI